VTSAGFRLVFVGLASSLLNSACTFRTLRHDLVQLDQTGTVHGMVQNAVGTLPVYAAAYDLGGSAHRLVDFQHVPEEAPYVFALPAQRSHAIAAFQDRNGDRRWSRGESAAFRYFPQLNSLGGTSRSYTASLVPLRDYPLQGWLLIQQISLSYPRNVNGHRNTVRMAGGIRCQVMGRELMERISH